MRQRVPSTASANCLRRGGHAAQALQEVERDAFAGEQRAGASADRGDDLAIGAAVAILLEDVQLIHAAAQLVDLPEQSHARKGERLTGQKTSGGHARFRHAGDAGDIARADIFFKREADNFVHGWWGGQSCPQPPFRRPCRAIRTLRASQGRLKAGCSQDWLPHKSFG